MPWAREVPISKTDRLPTLHTALDPARMAPVLEPVLRACLGPGWSVRDVDVAVFRRHANRCVLRYRVSLANGEPGHRTWGVIAKVQDPGVGEGVYHAMSQLWRCGFDRDAVDAIVIPEPYTFLAPLAMLLQEEIGGTPLRVLVREAPEPAHLRTAARALAKLHRSAWRTAEVRKMEDHLRRCHPRHQYIGIALPAFEPLVASIVDRARALERSLEPIAVAPAHGDFHLGQVHVDGDTGRAWLVDFDSLSQADPAADIANLLVFLKDKARRDPAVEALIAAFLEEYAARGCAEALDRVPLYEAITHLRRACKTLRLQEQGWSERIERMLLASSAALDEMERRRSGGAAGRGVA